jgi:thiol-disulfide isomerase/thioredoxin
MLRTLSLLALLAVAVARPVDAVPRGELSQVAPGLPLASDSAFASSAPEPGADDGQEAPVSAEELRGFYARFEAADQLWRESQERWKAWRGSWSGAIAGPGAGLPPQPLAERSTGQSTAPPTASPTAPRTEPEPGDGAPPETVPDPVPEFWAEMAAFESRGYSGARLWLLEHLDRARLADPQAERERLVRAAWSDPNLQAPVAAVRSRETVALAVMRLAGRLPREELDGWALGLLAEDNAPALRAAGLACLGAAALDAARRAGGRDTSAFLEAEELFDRVLSSYADTRAALACAPDRVELLLESYHIARAEWWSEWATRPQGVEPADHPALTFWPRFEQLAELEQGPALWWLILHAQHRGLSDAERVALRFSLMRQLIAGHADAPWLAEAIRGSEALVDELSVEAVLAVGERLLAVSTEPEVRAWTRFTMASLLSRDEADEARCERAVRLLEALAAEQPDHRLARAVPAKVFALRHLRVGCTPPDQGYTLDDAVERSLAELRGQGVLLAFWSTWDASGVDLVERLSALEREAGDDLRVLGINVDEDPDRVRGQLGERLEFDTVWSGSPAQGWPKAWGISDLPSLFLLDAEGRIAAKPRSLNELEALLDAQLAAEPAAGEPAQGERDEGEVGGTPDERSEASSAGR